MDYTDKVVDLATDLREYLNGFSMLPSSTSIAYRALEHIFPEISSPEELDELPEGTIFHSEGRLGRLWNKTASALDGGSVWSDKYDALPLTVIWKG